MRDIKFDWDLWNIQKNEIKHGVSALETESCFYDDNAGIYADLKHSNAKEQRYILYGKSLESRVLMIGFTIRKNKIRIIAARPASQNERKIYEKKNI